MPHFDLLALQVAARLTANRIERVAFEQDAVPTVPIPLVPAATL